MPYVVQWVPVNIIPTVHPKNMIICGIFYNAGVYIVYTNVYCDPDSVHNAVRLAKLIKLGSLLFT